MFFSVSSSGIYKNDFFNVEVTQMTRQNIRILLTNSLYLM